VALGNGGTDDIDALYALGVTPVAIAKDSFSSDDVYPWLKDRVDTEKTKLLDTLNGIDYEEIAALQPDLADHPGLDGRNYSLSMGNTPAKIFTIASEDDFAAKLMSRLGLGLTPTVTDIKTVSGSPTGELSFEQLDRLDADLVVILEPGFAKVDK
jgi:iron complex transport system substrate-binding protein